MMGLETQLPKEDESQEYTFTSSTPPSSGPTPAPDWRELRRQERAERHAARREARASSGYNWAGGIILILLGGIFLLQNTGLIERFDNWWALFILIPAIGSFAGAWNLYQHAGNQWTGAVTGSVVSGVILTSLAAAFLFGWNVGMLWPLFLIIGGLSILLGARR